MPHVCFQCQPLLIHFWCFTAQTSQILMNVQLIAKIISLSKLQRLYNMPSNLLLALDKYQIWHLSTPRRVSYPKHQSVHTVRTFGVQCSSYAPLRELCAPASSSPISHRSPRHLCPQTANSHRELRLVSTRTFYSRPRISFPNQISGKSTKSRWLDPIDCNRLPNIEVCHRKCHPA